MKSVTHLNSERFEVAFNRIQDALEKLLGIYNRGFADLVRIGARRHKIIKKFDDELLQFARLRNAIVHDKTELGYYIAEPHEKVVKRIEQIEALLSKPNPCLSIATKKVIYYFLDDPILKIINEMKHHNYSQFPIYNGGRCVGLLKSRTILKWLANQPESLVKLDAVSVNDVFVFERKHPMVFVPKSYSIFEIEDVFEEAHANKEMIELAIVTENGKATEKPLGVITPWDLIEIDYLSD